MPRETNITIRQGPSSDWSNSNPTLSEGELGWDSTNKIVKIGDNQNSWGNLQALNIPEFFSYSEIIGDGNQTSFLINHNLNANIEVFFTIRDLITGNLVYPDIKYEDDNNTIIEFVSAPLNNQYKVTILGIRSV